MEEDSEDSSMEYEEFYEADQGGGDEDVEEESEEESESVGSRSDEKREIDEGRALVATMTDDDLDTFLSRLESQAPPNDIQPFRKRVPALNWEEVAFGRFGAGECALIWSFLQSRTRRFRILNELVTEIKFTLEPRPENNVFWKKIIESTPGFPKKPPGMGAAVDMYANEEYLKEQKRMGGKKINYITFIKGVRKKFAQLSTKERQKYQDRADLEKARFEREAKEFYANYPGFDGLANRITAHGKHWHFPTVTKRSAQGVNRIRIKQECPEPPPDLPLAPFNAYLNSKLNKLDPPPTQPQLIHLKNKYKTAFDGLSDDAKGKWVQKSVKSMTKYMTAREEFLRKYPYYKFKPFSTRYYLRKEDIKLWLHSKGVPEKPKATVQEFFIRDYERKSPNTNKSPKEIREEAERAWAKIGWFEREDFTLRFKMEVNNYKREVETFFTSIPDFLKDPVLKFFPKKIQAALMEVAKTPMDVGIAGAQLPQDNGLEEAPEPPPSPVDGPPPKKKKKKDKKHREVEEDEAETLENTSFMKVEAMSPQKRHSGEEGVKKKKKKNKRKHSSEDEEVAGDVHEIVSNPRYNVPGLSTPNLTSMSAYKRGKLPKTLEKKGKSLAQGKEKLSELFQLKPGGKAKPKASIFVGGKPVSQKVIDEAIRGIFDGRPTFGRGYSVYYYYAKYVAGERFWIGALEDHGLCETARLMCETFLTLSEQQKQLHIDSSYNFYLRREHGPPELYQPGEFDAYNPMSYMSEMADEGKYWPGEPAEPVKNAYNLYDKHMADLVAKNPEYVPTPWDDLTDEDQAVYMKIMYQTTNEYLMKYQEFIEKMTPNDLISYTCHRAKFWDFTFCRRMTNMTVSEARGFSFPLRDDATELDFQDEGGPVMVRDLEERTNPFSGQSDLISRVAAAVEPSNVNAGRGGWAQSKVDTCKDDLPSSDSEDDGKKRKILPIKREIKKVSTYTYPERLFRPIKREALVRRYTKVKKAKAIAALLGDPSGEGESTTEAEMESLRPPVNIRFSRGVRRDGIATTATKTIKVTKKNYKEVAEKVKKPMAEFKMPSASVSEFLKKRRMRRKYLSKQWIEDTDDEENSADLAGKSGGKNSGEGEFGENNSGKEKSGGNEGETGGGTPIEKNGEDPEEIGKNSKKIGKNTGRKKVRGIYGKKGEEDQEKIGDEVEENSGKEAEDLEEIVENSKKIRKNSGGKKLGENSKIDGNQGPKAITKRKVRGQAGQVKDQEPPEVTLPKESSTAEDSESSEKEKETGKSDDKIAGNSEILEIGNKVVQMRGKRSQMGRPEVEPSTPLEKESASEMSESESTASEIPLQKSTSPSLLSPPLQFNYEAQGPSRQGQSSSGAVPPSSPTPSYTPTESSIPGTGTSTPISTSQYAAPSLVLVEMGDMRRYSSLDEDLD